MPTRQSASTMTRRQFAYATAASAATLVCPGNVFAQTYDLLITGGRVIDPSLRLNAILDVAVMDGRIAAVDSHIVADARDTIDARGRLVVPGLLDVHTHYARDREGPAIALADGVTGWVDAGSQGADGVADSVAIAESAPQVARVCLNIGRSGILPTGDTMDVNLADVDAAKAAIGRHPGVVAGVKARLSSGVAADDLEVMRRAQEVATAFDLPLMIHMGQTVSPLDRLFPLLKRGDVVTHMFAPPPNSIVDDNGRIRPEVLSARRRGVWFDVANGRTGHLRWDTFDHIMQAGFWPDTISTDGNTTSGTTAGVIDFPNVMSKFLSFGMTLDQVVACATVNASRVFPFFNDRGTLNVGAPADIAILELRNGMFEFVDNYRNTRQGGQRLFPSETVLGGRRAATA